MKHRQKKSIKISGQDRLMKCQRGLNQDLQVFQKGKEQTLRSCYVGLFLLLL